MLLISFMKPVMAQFWIISGEGVQRGDSFKACFSVIIILLLVVGVVLLSTMQEREGPTQGSWSLELIEMLSETDVILLCNEYLSGLSTEGRAELKKLLVELKRQQEESLFDLEKQYCRLVSDRRTLTVSALKAHAADKSFVGEPLRALVSQTDEELTAFMKIRVHGEWQAGQMIRQRDRLVQFGFPERAFDRIEDVKFTRELIQLIWDKC